MSERAAPQASSAQPPVPAAPALLLQRKCACGGQGGGTCAACAQEDERKRVQRRASGPAPAPPGVTPSVRQALASPGRPLSSDTRTSLEPLFAADFSRVRVHDDEAAARSARDIAADAYTVGHDVVFARGRFAPETRAGRALLAHELTHVVQQRAGLSPRLTDGPASEAHEREADAMAERATAAPAVAAFIAEDDAPSLAPGQLRRGTFLARLRPALCRAADAELARVGQDSRDCPYLERAFAQFETQSAAQLERTMRRFAPRSARASSADEAITLVAARVAQGVRQWATTGRLPELPEGLTLDLPGGMFGGLLGGLLGGASGLLGGLSRLFFKAAPGAPAPSASTAPASALPAGAPLAPAVRETFSGALGHALPDVRVHTGGEATALNARFGSRAFTLGRHIAFGPGEYQPGTPVGDALLAHELAHVVQQGRDVDAATLPGAQLPSAGDASLEADADEAATGAVLSIWGRTARGLRELRRQTGPRLRSGLKLQMSSCGGGGQAAAGRTTTPTARAAAGVTCPAAPAVSETAGETRPSRPDAQAQAIITAATAESTPIADRAGALVTAILCRYYPTQIDKVEGVTYRQSQSGLETQSVGRGASARGHIYVGDNFVGLTNERLFSRQVLSVGHELQHIDQYRSGLAGEDRGTEREFLARTWTSLRDELPGTGRMPDAVRRDTIDKALECYYCLTADQQRTYQDRKDALLARRATVNGTRGNDPTDPPTACPPRGCRQ
jgi:hypothetical protein